VSPQKVSDKLGLDTRPSHLDPSHPFFRTSLGDPLPV
jgi:hypothetical protein